MARRLVFGGEGGGAQLGETRQGGLQSWPIGWLVEWLEVYHKENTYNTTQQHDNSSRHQTTDDDYGDQHHDQNWAARSRSIESCGRLNDSAHNIHWARRRGVSNERPKGVERRLE